ncbi:FitA-like ribbon-helix-helix domain-containing protein [Acidipropionibacterium acidipropionici]|uniref:FitA-like ribbon-helix-helix domain-containing protein n=1 Tax=Acidipropionibacterium acidipropionici TaxID=1748 RepID=UPI00110BF275|nr:plasmid stabilization protein [Acidipropionibacterium acidipropionici]QCV93950.1 plasmid stabilization protein [Acidipropionibacterium acidipropionici]
MAQLLVRDLDEGVLQWLRERGARHGRSMEAEARDLLTRARMRDVEDPIGWILEYRRGRRGAEPVELPNSIAHEHADFE